MSKEEIIQVNEQALEGIYYRCPSCNISMYTLCKSAYCPNCGQKIGWEKVESSDKEEQLKREKEQNEPWVLENF